MACADTFLRCVGRLAVKATDANAAVRADHSHHLINLIGNR